MLYSYIVQATQAAMAATQEQPALSLKLSVKCQTLEELVAVLDKASRMISAGCKCSTLDYEGAAAFGFEITYDDQSGSWFTYDELANGVAFKFGALKQLSELSF
jgi:hypothetical protein